MPIPPGIFPAAIIEYSVEKHFHDYHSRTRLIYILVLAGLLIGFISLFFIKVDISVRSPGAFRSMNERTEIRAAVNGMVDTVFVTENTYVKAGQPLFKVNAQEVNEKSALEHNNYSELAAQMHDLEALTNNIEEPLQTNMYSQQNKLFQQQLTSARLKLSVINKSYNRYSSLYQGKIVSSSEFERYEYEKNAAESELAAIQKQQYAQWQTELAEVRRQMQQIKTSSHVTQQQKGMYTIQAPVSGYVQQWKGVHKGSFVTAGEQMGDITPDAGLIAEAYVSTRDIGLLKTGTPVRMQVDAFDYNSWGMLNGTVQSISEDVFTAEGQPPYFKVKCIIPKYTLQLRNGYKAQVKKGMTLQARFQVTRRSLYQLLYDRIDDWLNPNTAV